MQTLQAMVKIQADMNVEEVAEEFSKVAEKYPDHNVQEVAEQYRKEVEEIAKNLAGTRMQAGVAEGLPLPRAKAKSNVGQMRKE